MSYLEQLAEQCEAWGGELVILPEKEWSALPWGGRRGYAQAPFTSGLGINWRAKKIYLYDEANEWAGVIHEMGHIFACRYSPASDIEEADFFGWEVRMVDKIGAPRASFLHDNALYQIEWPPESARYVEFGNMKPKETAEAINHLIGVSYSLGLLDDQLWPKNIRP